MRIIKFRAWNKDTKHMVDLRKITPFATDIKGLFIPDNDDLTNLELMQFTGLLDKNKKEVYEGDILRVKCLDKYNTDIFEAIIKWYQPEASFHLEEKTSHGFRYWGTQQTESIEVIGNIYESPELISNQ